MSDILCRLDESYSESQLGTTEDLELSFYVPEEWEYATEDDGEFNDEVTEVTVASLWENIRKKKEREGKDYKPAKPGDKDRPDPKAWKKAQSQKYSRLSLEVLEDRHFAHVEDKSRSFPIYSPSQVKNSFAKLNFSKLSPELKASAVDKVFARAEELQLGYLSTAGISEYFYRSMEEAAEVAKKIGMKAIFQHTTFEGETYWIPGSCFEDLEEWYENEEEISDEISEEAMAAEYQGRKVKLNKPFRTPGGPKKFAVYTTNESGNVVIVRFGDPERSIKKHIPARRKSFRARHKCDTNPGPKWKARYWSCRAW